MLRDENVDLRERIIDVETDYVTLNDSYRNFITVCIERKLSKRNSVATWIVQMDKNWNIYWCHQAHLFQAHQNNRMPQPIDSIFSIHVNNDNKSVSESRRCTHFTQTRTTAQFSISFAIWFEKRLQCVNDTPFCKLAGINSHFYDALTRHRNSWHNNSSILLCSVQTKARINRVYRSDSLHANKKETTWLSQKPKQNVVISCSQAI